MSREEFFLHVENTYGSCSSILKVKNTDYSGSSDPFRNFRNLEDFGYSVEEGIVYRMSDKLSRIANLVKRKQQVGEVKDESISDTLKDMINYSAILLAFIESEKPNAN